MSILTSYLLADEEEKKKQREGYMDILRNSHAATLVTNADKIPSVIKAGVKDVASQVGDSTTDLFANIPFNLDEGMITGAWNKAKEIGGEWWENISRDPTVYMDAYTTYWLNRLGHKGPPLKEDIVYKGVEKLWEDDYRKYWDERPLDYDWFNR